MNFKKVLIAVDSSKYSKKAAEKGFLLAAELDAEVSIIYIINWVDTVGSIDAVIIPTEPDKAEIEQGYMLLDEYEKMFAGNIKPLKKVKVGDPAREILKFAREFDAEVIVLGRHGLESFKHLVFGGVVDYVATHTNIPVLLVPYPE